VAGQKLLIGEDWRARAARAARSGLSADPEGVPAADFSADELIYLPRNCGAQALRDESGRADRTHRQFALRPDAATSIPTSPVRRLARSPPCQRSGRPTRSAPSRIISTRRCAAISRTGG
jgi:hypothetical protein